MKVNSDHVPEKFTRSKGKLFLNFNIIQTEKADEHGTRTVFDYDSIEIKNKNEETVSIAIKNELKKAAYNTMIQNAENGFKSSVRGIEMTYREIDCIRFTMSQIKTLVRDKHNVNHIVTEEEFKIIKKEVLKKATQEQVNYWEAIK